MATGQKRRNSAVVTTLHEDRVPGSWHGHSVFPWAESGKAQAEERRQQPQQVSDRDRLFRGRKLRKPGLPEADWHKHRCLGGRRGERMNHSGWR